MNTTLIITLTAIILSLSACHFCTLDYRYRKFKRNVKSGDPVRFYIGEEKDTGELISIDGCIATIRTIEGVKSVYIDNIYPVSGYRYSSNNNNI